MTPVYLEMLIKEKKREIKEIAKQQRLLREYSTVHPPLAAGIRMGIPGFFVCFGCWLMKRLSPDKPTAMEKRRSG